MLDLPPLVADLSPIEPSEKGLRCGGARADLYLPDREAHGLVLLWHGEAPDASLDWGIREQVRLCRPFRGWASLLTGRGLAVAAIEHRTSAGWDRPDAPAEDFSEVVDRFRSFGALGVMAFSGGIPVAYTLGQASCRAIVTAYGPLDLSGEEYRSHYPGMTDELEARWSPLRLVSAASPPHLHLEPADDWLPNGTRRFSVRAREVGAPFELEVHPSGSHGFDFLSDDDRSREMIARACDFFDRELVS